MEGNANMFTWQWGKKCLPKGTATEQASLEETLIPAKHYLQAVCVWIIITDCDSANEQCT